MDENVTSKSEENVAQSLSVENVQNLSEENVVQNLSDEDVARNQNVVQIETDSTGASRRIVNRCARDVAANKLLRTATTRKLTHEADRDSHSTTQRHSAHERESARKRKRKHNASLRRTRKHGKRDASKRRRRVAKKRRKWLDSDHLRALTHYARFGDVLVEHAFRAVKADRLLTIMPFELQVSSPYSAFNEHFV